MKLAVIPARGGSKRVPRKNIKPFMGKPMIAWTVEAALNSRCFDRVIVSTDDEEIAAVAREYGADVPFMRPAALADDHTGTMPVIAHAIEWEEARGRQPDLVCCIYPTAAFLQAQYLLQGLQAMAHPSTEYALSVTSYAFPLQRAIRLTSDKSMEMLHPEFVNTRSQDLEVLYHDAAQFYWGRRQSWVAQRPILTSRTTPIVLPHYLVQDIDTLEDWIHAEFKFSRYLAQHIGKALT